VDHDSGSDSGKEEVLREERMGFAKTQFQYDIVFNKFYPEYCENEQALPRSHKSGSFLLPVLLSSNSVSDLHKKVLEVAGSRNRRGNRYSIIPQDYMEDVMGEDLDSQIVYLERKQNNLFITSILHKMKIYRKHIDSITQPERRDYFRDEVSAILPRVKTNWSANIFTYRLINGVIIYTFTFQFYTSVNIYIFTNGLFYGINNARHLKKCLNLRIT